MGCSLKGASPDSASVARHDEACYSERLSKCIDSTSIIISLFSCKGILQGILNNYRCDEGDSEGGDEGSDKVVVKIVMKIVIKIVIKIVMQIYNFEFFIQSLVQLHEFACAATRSKV